VVAVGGGLMSLLRFLRTNRAEKLVTHGDSAKNVIASKEAVINLLKHGKRCKSCVYTVLKNPGHYCGAWVKEPSIDDIQNCKEFANRKDVSRIY